MAFEFRTKRRVEFAETDMAGIMHFSNFFRYMETAEHEFFRSLGLSVHNCSDGRCISWPRVDAQCSYEAPLAFDDEVEVHVLVRAKKRVSITYEFRFFKPGRVRPVARGSITAVCALVDGQTGRMAAIPIPDEISDKIQVAPDDMLKEGAHVPVKC